MKYMYDSILKRFKCTFSQTMFTHLRFWFLCCEREKKKKKKKIVTYHPRNDKAREQVPKTQKEGHRNASNNVVWC
jgi:hypothetical protein